MLNLSGQFGRFLKNSPKTNAERLRYGLTFDLSDEIILKFATINSTMSLRRKVLLSI